jgi:hypothetical protein
VGRQRVPKGQVFLKKEEKIEATVNALNANHSEDQFVEKFQELYPKDWGKIVTRYEAHERLTPEGKTHPMAHPKQYLINAYKAAMKKSPKPSA